MSISFPFFPLPWGQVELQNVLAWNVKRKTCYEHSFLWFVISVIRPTSTLTSIPIFMLLVLLSGNWIAKKRDRPSPASPHHFPPLGCGEKSRLFPLQVSNTLRKVTSCRCVSSRNINLTTTPTRKRYRTYFTWVVLHHFYLSTITISIRHISLICLL